MSIRAGICAWGLAWAIGVGFAPKAGAVSDGTTVIGDWTLQVTEENVFAISKSYGLKIPLEYDVETPQLISSEPIANHKGLYLLKYRSGTIGTTTKFFEVRAVVFRKGQVVADEVWSREKTGTHEKLPAPEWKWDASLLEVTDPATDEKNAYKL